MEGGLDQWEDSGPNGVIMSWMKLMKPKGHEVHGICTTKREDKEAGTQVDKATMRKQTLAASRWPNPK